MTDQQATLPDNVRNTLLQCARRVPCSNTLANQSFATCAENEVPAGLRCPNCEWRTQGLEIVRDHA